MTTFTSWLLGSVLLGSSAICGGYGAGLMWRSWRDAAFHPQTASPLMVERVARALRQHDCDEILSQTKTEIPDWDSDTDLKRREAYLKVSRVAIEAMRQPTGPMIWSATRFENRLGEGRVEVNYGVVAMDIWPKMIDAALNPPTPKAGP